MNESTKRKRNQSPNIENTWYNSNFIETSISYSFYISYNVRKLEISSILWRINLIMIYVRYTKFYLETLKFTHWV